MDWESSQICWLFVQKSQAGQGIKNKLAQFCDVAPEAVIESLDVEHLYQIPIELAAQGMDQIVCDHLKLDAPVADMTEWSAMVDKVMNLKKTSQDFPCW